MPTPCRARATAPGGDQDPGDGISSAAVDDAGGWLYYSASAQEPTRRYLYRTRLDGSGRAERLTPANQPGVHSYDISPNGQWAVHTHSRFDQPPVSELVRLPAHETVRVTQDNTALKDKVAAMMAGRTEFVQVDAGDGVTIDGWLMRPRDFDPAKKYPSWSMCRRARRGECRGKEVRQSHALPCCDRRRRLSRCQLR
jgi:dipeptidyl-peptidase-4